MEKCLSEYLTLFHAIWIYGSTTLSTRLVPISPSTLRWISVQSGLPMEKRLCFVQTEKNISICIRKIQAALKLKNCCLAQMLIKLPPIGPPTGNILHFIALGQKQVLIFGYCLSPATENRSSFWRQSLRKTTLIFLRTCTGSLISPTNRGKMKCMSGHSRLRV